MVVLSRIDKENLGDNENVRALGEKEKRNQVYYRFSIAFIALYSAIYSFLNKSNTKQHSTHRI